jgi:hypothetical protein
MDLNAIAVVLDFMEPLLALGRFGLQGGELGFNEPRHLDTLLHSGNSQKPAAPWGQRRAFYLLPDNLEQSGDVTCYSCPPERDHGNIECKDNQQRKRD